METRHNSFFAPQLVLGLGIILIGILFPTRQHGHH